MRRGFLIGFFATLAVGAMMLIGASVGLGLSHAERIMPGVSVAGVPLGGLDRAAAAARLEAQLPSLTNGAIVLKVDDEAVEIPLADLGRAYDLQATLDAAFAVTRQGNPLSDGIARLQTLTGPTALSRLALRHDQGAIDGLVADIAQRFNRLPADATVTSEAARGFVATNAVEGLTVDADALRTSLHASLAAPTLAGTTTIDIPVARAQPQIGSREARTAAIKATWMTGAPLELTTGRKAFRLNRAALTGLISFGPLDDGGWGVNVDNNAVRTLLRPLAPKVARAPREASFLYGPSGVVGVVAGADGHALKLKVSAANVVAALEQRAAGSAAPSAALAIGVARPNLTTEEAQKVAPVMRQISSWTTYYAPGEGNFWGANISIPARDLDGMVIAPGAWFDFWRDIGPVTVARGYGYGGVIIGGRSVANGALAGGICSTSTTLFNAAMRAGLEIGQKVNHSYYIERYPVGLDATVLKTDTYTTTMEFRNDTDNPIVIRAYTGNGFVRFDIWGVPNGRTVTLSNAVKSNYGTAHWTTVVNSDLAPGTSIIREYPHDGFDTSVTRWVRDANGNLVHEDTWFSHYNTVNGVTEVGPRR
jgi:vancomycin resistance protein YoaR